MPKDHTPRILAIHDLACLGRCSLTVIIPALSAMGVSVVPLPTALFSSHTGGFPDVVFTDLTHTMQPALEQYQGIGLKFNAIFTGFLGSAVQIDTVIRAIRMFGSGIPVLVDPVMGDNGKVYKTYTPEMCLRMHELCRHADILTPNLTEAYLLCNDRYADPAYLPPEQAVEEAKRLLSGLAERFPAKQIALTGVELSDGRIATLSFDRTCDDRKDVIHIFPRIPQRYPGTGDLFASVMLGYLQNGADFHTAVNASCRTAADIIADTAQHNLPQREGLRLEKNLWRLTQI